jgi:hypothetical protein
VGCKAAGGGILGEGLLQGGQIVRDVNVRTGVEHRAQKAVAKQAAESVGECKFRPQSKALEKATARPAESDEVIAAVGTRTEHCVCGAQFCKRQPKHGGSKEWRVSPDYDHARVLPEQLCESVPESLREAAALLPPSLQNGWDDFPGQSSACGEHVTRQIAFEFGDFADGISHKRPVKLRRSVGTQRSDEPRLCFTGDNGAGKDNHGRRPLYACAWN